MIPYYQQKLCPNICSMNVTDIKKKLDMESWTQFYQVSAHNSQPNEEIMNGHKLFYQLAFLFVSGITDKKYMKKHIAKNLLREYDNQYL